jgi:hypothetical protein
MGRSVLDELKERLVWPNHPQIAPRSTIDSGNAAFQVFDFSFEPRIAGLKTAILFNLTLNLSVEVRHLGQAAVTCPESDLQDDQQQDQD